MAASTFSLVAEDESSDLGSLTATEIRNHLQKGNDELKLAVMRYLITAMINGRDFVSRRPDALARDRDSS